jgi:F-type H+-transporting ATPase subunit b
LKHSIITSRFSARICSLVFLSMLSLGSTVSPARLLAQEPTPAAAASAAGEKEPPSSEKGEEQNVYRHTPLVRSLARGLHMNVETTATLLEVLNFAVIFFAIVIPLFRTLPKIMRKRSETLRHDLESARQLTAEANQRLSAVEAQLAKLDQEIASIRVHVEEESRNDEARIKSSIGEETSRIVAAAEQEIAAAAAQAKRGLRHFAADLAVEQAAKKLVLTPETDRALIAEFVGDSAKGGQN